MSRELWDMCARDAARAEVLRNVAAGTGVAIADIVGPSRKARVVDARGLVIWALRERGWSTPLIARAVNRSHVTVLHALGRLGRQRKERAA